jgi:transposase
VAYRANGLTIRYRRLAAVGNLIALPIAIERPSGIVVDSLIEAGHAVVPIHPNAIKASQPRPRAAAISRCAEAEQDASGEVLLALATTLERLVAYIATATARIRHDVAQLPEGRVVMSFPRAGQVCAAQITAELGCMRQRFPFADTLATEAGCTPVTR